MKKADIRISGTIDRQSYLSISKYMLSPLYRICFIAVVVLMDTGLLWLTYVLKDLVWLLLPLMLSLGAVAFWRWNLKNVVNRVIASTPGIKEGKGFDLDIDLHQDAIRVHNRATGVDTALSYELFGSYALTDQVLALFVKTGTYLLIPVSNVTDELRDEALAYVKAHCSGLRRRHF